VADPSPELVPLPVGFERFHPRAFVNYQLNRAYALGFADHKELHAAAARVKAIDDCVAVFEDLASRAVADGRTRDATSYLRLAEFFTPPRSAAKRERYRRFRDLFDVAFAGGGMVRHGFHTPPPRFPPICFRHVGRLFEAQCCCTAGLTHSSKSSTRYGNASPRPGST
jgi:hypothetical protein